MLDLPISKSESPSGARPQGILPALQRFQRAPGKEPIERCDLCGAGLGAGHAHLLEQSSRRVACACDACAILLCGVQGAKYLRIPRRILRLDSFALTDAQWESLTVPINLAFFVQQSGGGTRALYPSPAGAMESLVDLPPWQDLFVSDLVLAGIEPEVEGVLVNRIAKPAEYFLAPLDECYRFVGMIRTRWRGLSGGPEVWQAIREFFADLDRRAAHAAPDGPHTQAEGGHA